jgi:aryl-phospho-beta-D-glucosidase BglC (GH1 family)
LSKVFKGNKTVAGYDVMNEPNGISVATWEAYSQSVVTALRGAGDNTLLWIEGANWSQAEQWTQFEPTPWIHDPADNFMYSAHQYFVQYSNYPQGYDFGQYASFEQQVLDGLKSFTDWLARYNVRGSIGEVGWPNSKETSSWQEWNELAEKWYELADAAHLWVTYFSATSVYDEAQDAYDAPHNSDGCRSHSTPGPTCRPPGISVAESQASVIEAHPSTG